MREVLVGKVVVLEQFLKQSSSSLYRGHYCNWIVNGNNQTATTSAEGVRERYN